MRKLLIVLYLFLSYSLLIKASDIIINRFDKQLYNYIQTGANKNSTQKNYLLFIQALSKTLNIANESNDLDTLALYFNERPSLKQVYTYTENKFKDVSVYEQQLNKSLLLAKTKMSVNDQSVFYTHVSGWKENIIAVNNIISISLDKYLGADCPYYGSFFNQQQLLNMIPEMIVRDYIKAWLMYNYVYPSKEDVLLSEMIYQGKVIYIMTQILPEYTIAQLLGKTDIEIENLKSLAKKNWKNILANDLYSKDNSVQYHWMENESQLGIWLGYSIVNRYMSNTNKSIDDLLKMSDSEVLKGSKYTPQ